MRRTSAIASATCAGVARCSATATTAGVATASCAAAAARRCACRSTCGAASTDAVLSRGRATLRAASASRDARCHRARTHPRAVAAGPRHCSRRRGRTAGSRPARSTARLNVRTRRARPAADRRQPGRRRRRAGNARCQHRRAKTSAAASTIDYRKFAATGTLSRSTASCAAANSWPAMPTSHCRRRRWRCSVNAEQHADEGWQLPRSAWRDGDVLVGRRQRRASAAMPACAASTWTCTAANLAARDDALPVRLAGASRPGRPATARRRSMPIAAHRCRPAAGRSDATCTTSTSSIRSGRFRFDGLSGDAAVLRQRAGLRRAALARRRAVRTGVRRRAACRSTVATASCACATR